MVEHKVTETLWQPKLKLAKSCGQPSGSTLKATIDLFEKMQQQLLR